MQVCSIAALVAVTGCCHWLSLLGIAYQEGHAVLAWVICVQCVPYKVTEMDVQENCNLVEDSSPVAAVKRSCFCVESGLRPICLATIDHDL